VVAASAAVRAVVVTAMDAVAWKVGVRAEAATVDATAGGEDGGGEAGASDSR